MNSKSKDQAAASRVTWVGLLANLLLAGFKFAAGLLGNSAALVADAAHSLSDLASDVVVLIGLRIAARPKDLSHPYGHGKVETAAALSVGALVCLAGLGIMFDATHKLYDGTRSHPLPIVLVAAGTSIVVKELLYRWTVAVGRRTRHSLLIANAWHHRSDALSSVAVLIGAGGAMLGVPYLDLLAALAVSVFVVRAGVTIGWDALRDLLDTAVDTKLRKRIGEIICDTPGVISCHRLRTRKVGEAVFVDVHIEVRDELSILEAHKIADRAELRLLGDLPVDDVIVHVEPTSAVDCRDHDRA
ncbi:MAG: cation diffusion facilitator family transporter [Candidatus Alcyoniella australis]|nr:cation diffusion facilitator family transporter [Candidatus Alcyoniella australis]